MLKCKMFSTGIILLLAITMSTAAQIEGMWQVNNSNDFVEIRSTAQGIKAKFVDSRNWDKYERLRKGIFEDRKGNRYYVKSNNRITWESRDGRRVLNLEKSRYGGRSADRYDEYNYSRNDQNGKSSRQGRSNIHTSCTTSCGASCTFDSRFASRYDDGVSGTWVTRRRNLIAYVEYDGLNLRMKTNQARRWTTYRRAHRRKMIFEDKWGNRLRIRNSGKLEWRRADRRRAIDFIR